MCGELKAVIDELFRHEGEDIDGVVYEVDGARHNNGLGIGINRSLAVVVF